MKKILTESEVDLWVAESRRRGKRIGYTCGVFDIVHAGHVAYLRRARELCDALLVAVNSDRSVRSYKSPLRPLMNELHRMAVVAALEPVDTVTLLDAERPLEHLTRWKPDLYIKGGDYQAAELRCAGVVRAYGGQVVTIPREIEISTSEIIERAAAVHSHWCDASLRRLGSRGLVLLDRDGTLIEDVPYLHEPSLVKLLPGVGEGLARLQNMGLALAIVTNQQGIGLGYYTTRDFIAVNQELFRQLRRYAVKFAKVYFCPHSAADGCRCRKPGTLLIEKALQEFRVPPTRCYLVGDSEEDYQAALSAGCVPLRVGQGHGSFGQAVDIIEASLGAERSE